MVKPHVLVTPGSFTDHICWKLSTLGASVHILAPNENPYKMYEKASHILLPGGADIHPSYYNTRVRFAHPVASRRDPLEYGLATLALADAKPIMGICRGHQMICVVAGGTLHQDIWQDTGIEHRSNIHGIVIVSRSRLSRILKTRTCQVNSLHHQAVADVPAGWRIAATAGGIVESIEHPRLPVISVQWHPEILQSPASTALFASFLALS